MNKKPFTLAAIIATTVSLVTSPSLLAQTSDVNENSLLEEVIVTATKREESIYEVPIAITAFTQAGIERQGITDLTDIGKFVPNLNVTGFSAGHTSSVNPFIRGIGLQDHLITTDPGVGVYIDGVYLGRQVGQNWSLANIERVEVLRGPQGTLYGRNSIGGAINIITRQPGMATGTLLPVFTGSKKKAPTNRSPISSQLVRGHSNWARLPRARPSTPMSASKPPKPCDCQAVCVIPRMTRKPGPTSIAV